MQDNRKFDALIVVTPQDCERLMPLYPRLIDNFEYGRICFIGSEGVKDVFEKNSKVREKAFFVDENSLIPFEAVHSCMAQRLRELLKGKEMPRGVTGWYYQQFLKMQYSEICQDEYYMVWDGDTIPCRQIHMFHQETGKPYMDLKHEYHPEYFVTLSKLIPGLQKVIERSFISEHMLFQCNIMKEMIGVIEANPDIPGTKFWEKIINCISPEKICESSFSEFESYGTYVTVKHPDAYISRDWHSFRLGSQFFSIDTIKERDFNWLGKDFDAISFEKNQEMVGDGTDLFTNPYYQEKLSAKQMLQAIQMEFNGGYKEVWADDPVTMKNANITIGRFTNGRGIDNRTLIAIISDGNQERLNMSVRGIEESMSPLNYKIVTAEDDGNTYYSTVNKAIKTLDGTEFEDWDIFVIKSGTRVVFDTVHFLKHAIYSGDGFGAAGCVSNLAGNDQQVDVKFDTPEEYIKFGEKNNVLMEDPFVERVVLSGNGVLITREAYNKIGGFDESYGRQGRAGDIDYSLRLRNAGYKLLMVKNSFVYREVWDENEDSVSPEDRQKLEASFGKEVIGKLMGEQCMNEHEEHCDYTTEMKNRLIDIFTAAQLKYVEAVSDYQVDGDKKKFNESLAVCIGSLTSLAKGLEGVVINYFVSNDIPLYYIFCDKELSDEMQLVLKRALNLLFALVKYLSEVMTSDEGDIYHEESMSDWGELALLLRFDILAPPQDKIEDIANMGNVYSQLDKLAELNRDFYLVKQMWLSSSNSFLPQHEDSDLAIVMQGPIHTERNFTLEILMRYRKTYPNAAIILSTWEGEVSREFRFQAECIGILILENQQPADSGPWNIKYQLTSSLKGIELAEQIEGVKYVLKTRTDQAFLLPDFLILFRNTLKSYPAGNPNISERIVFPGGFSSMCTYPFRITDFFTFGRVEDLKNYYSSTGDCEKLLYTSSDPEKKRQQFLDVMGRTPYDNYAVFSKLTIEQRRTIVDRIWDKIDPETYLASSFYERVILKRQLTLEDDIMMHYWNFVKNCAVFVDIDDILFLWKKYRNQYMDLSSNISEGGMTHSTWLQMYYDDRFKV
jgi:hypothetical protein